MSVATRWLVCGSLTTESFLHVGSGAVVTREGLRNEETGEPIQVSAVAVDHRRRPYLPATALKGLLRRRLVGLGLPAGRLDPLLGHAPTEEREERQWGAKLEVWDAPLDDASAPALTPPYWDPARWSGVAARVSIDRRTGAAAHQRLFHLEQVPPGAVFSVTLSGSLSEEEVAWVLAALEGFNDPVAPLLLGAETVESWGKFAWRLEEVRSQDEAAVARWLAAGAPTSGYDALEPIATKDQDELVRRAEALSPKESLAPALLRLDLVLVFDSPFLVNDPSRTGSGQELPDHAALLDAEGRPYLPAASFRGVLRSQAERILRTVRGPAAACGPGAERPPCEPPGAVGDLPHLCRACRIFGAAGWRSPLTMTDFTARRAEDAGQELRQEFLAIDRFSGGGADEWRGLEEGAKGLKFNAEGFDRPTLRGRIDVDLAALSRARCTSCALGLLALVLRDLVEGDLGFGWGGGKGYGRCTAEIEGYRLPAWETLPESIRRELAQVGLEDPEALARPAEALCDPESDLGFALMAALVDLAEVPIDERAQGGPR